MKKCPICGAIAFDDARTCYGCLHGFGSGDGRLDALGTAGGHDDAPVALDADGGAPAFLVKFVPVEEAGRMTWSCEVRALAKGEAT